MVKFILLSFFILNASVLFAKKTEAEKIKICLAAIYWAQEAYFDQHQHYSDRLESASIAINCPGLALDYSQLKENTYTIKAIGKKSVWQIDETRTIRRSN
jgi:hypothetical protein